ncbi:hypothetical protein A2X44_03155 [candidate division CPR3 bacterium GWF2_35_18]|uniref:Trypsin domain protein n=1 Tax=candidate division CPR3 bacterium GW2011_GWF2_35_18 TaxID=1618350 RepID=A0A0G0BJ34_UNCC3|nr:MAG: Trypsin domain protein [candidate division CPR3 bacterium GW2011_GWF2_35_18]OGB62976.1 MAG: hypothetical protein A2X44_03155 [candidate division CPR3 bacterium GWF2_35_18]OGB65898.1 MAG: hypothetical protein A2250_03235 [candidate division CPR3 bacterium RIFOXYA2_FULL_35_13]OGB76728.1 MAG: hypothetical protein A2476_00445 [candidate division CPR3 bacterium RIFOXYC2_FULL_35_7]OGB78929.1 MAG: hypothetical protein A2296_00055 [candidate division CPR3 bacterium RIFOXYB2_FULL_35_8]
MKNAGKKILVIVLSVFVLTGFSFFAGFSGGIVSLMSLKIPLFEKMVPDFLKESIKEVNKQTVIEEESATISIVEESSPAVVSIVAKTTGFDFFNGPYSNEQSIGTGFIIDANGIILTNRHVVSDTSATYSVVTKDKKTYEIKQIERDTAHDLAILKIEATDLSTLTLGDSDALKVGQKVIAIGNALGQFDNTVTTGVVSGLGRLVTASSGVFGSSEVLQNTIQTDAALNPGNSGGPLLDYGGNVIGINVAVTQGAENIGFSIPINLIKSVVENFQENGKIVRPFLGVEYIMISSEMSSLRNIPEGAYISSVVKDSPAEKAGVKKADVITKINGISLKTENNLAQVIAIQKVGDEVKLTIIRDGKEIELKATLQEASE